jgi:hypothetical protein
MLQTLMQDILIFLYFWNHLRVKSVMLSRRYQIKYDGVCIFRLIAYRYLFDEKKWIYVIPSQTSDFEM